MVRMGSADAEKRAAQVEFANRLLRLMSTAKASDASFDEAVDLAAQILLEARRPNDKAAKGFDYPARYPAE